MQFVNSNRPQSEMTASPDKYPQGYFKDKKCKECSSMFSPLAPSHLFCSQECFDDGHARRRLWKDYKITLEAYRQMFEDQDHKCAICKSEGFKICEAAKSLLVVDHCHTTGVVRGLLCHNCNRGLGLFQDSIEFINNAASYLERASTIPQGSTPQAIGGGSAQHPENG